MNIKEAELLFQADVLETPVIQKHASGDGWTVTLSGKHKLNSMLETAHGQVRVFKRLDATLGMLFEVGFGEITIVR
ncbi:hypothetical protein GO003_024060 [Methylicorpusculum oleiharenae]|uniref:hypothetical protein n=1 Tax=Methylicorpusculum oleiharenae TaxID=1338687 RepID=UPI001356DEC3|nr:hypothetical protein [Methylicorpusculum oleiharenae]